MISALDLVNVAEDADVGMAVVRLALFPAPAAAADLGQHGRHLGQRQRLRTRHLVDAALVAVTGERFHGHRGDVVDIDERFTHLSVMPKAIPTWRSVRT